MRGKNDILIEIKSLEIKLGDLQEELKEFDGFEKLIEKYPVGTYFSFDDEASIGMVSEIDEDTLEIGVRFWSVDSTDHPENKTWFDYEDFKRNLYRMEPLSKEEFLESAKAIFLETMEYFDI